MKAYYGKIVSRLTPKDLLVICIVTDMTWYLVIHSLDVIILVNTLEFPNMHEHEITIIIFKMSILLVNKHLTSRKLT